MRSLIKLQKSIASLSPRLHCFAKHCWQVLLALSCFALCPVAQAINPAPDGGYPGGNTAEGQNALLGLSTGTYNTAVGFLSLESTAIGTFNTAIGAGALLVNTADENTATGAGALLSNSTGEDNSANGAFALFNNTTGSDNTAVGAAALLNNTEGEGNTANGSSALRNNTIGIENTATGDHALWFNTGSGNTANGAGALISNTIGNFNTATGFSALSANTTGNGNTAIGRYTLTITTGSGNTALGTNAGSALTTGNFNIDIGVDVIGVAGESNTIRIGANLPETPGASACHIGGIYNQSSDPATMTAVGIDVTGKLGTAVSSRRFKRDIKPMDKASEAILALKPVAFHYKSDAKNTPCFGLIAEEVAGVNPDLVVRNKNGEIWSVRYDQVNAMLLNEFLKEHKAFLEEQRKVQEQQTTIGQLKSNAAKQEATISELKKDLQTVVARLKDQDSKTQKVSDEMELSRSAPRMVLSNP
jgi:Chaperone of endosialidase